MVAETLIISCPACRSHLTLLASYAGMTGPCPTCKTLIQVPYPPQASAQPSYPQLTTGQSAYPQPPYPAYEQTASSQFLGGSLQAPLLPAPPGTYFMTPQGLCYIPRNPQPVYHPPRDSTPPPPPVSLTPPPAERRADLHRSFFQGRPATRLIQGTANSPDPYLPAVVPERKTRRNNRHQRSILPLICVVGLLGLIFGVYKVLKGAGSSSKSKPAAVAAGNGLQPAGTSPKSGMAGASPLVNGELAPLEPPPSLPDGMPAVAQGQAAIEALEKFFAAKTLAERLPLIETETPESELAASVIAGPLPTVTYLELDTTASNPIEQVTDYYHSVNLQLEGGQVSQQTILVRSRGGASPKVIIDPFLDSYGGRLAAYAKAPSDKAVVFRVIVAPIASCNDSNIPSPEKKMTLKFLPHEGSKEISRAYFSRQSKIAQMLEDGTYDFNFSSAKACTVMLRWNTEENSDMPYLEALSLKALNWNP